MEEGSNLSRRFKRQKKTCETKVMKRQQKQDWSSLPNEIVRLIMEQQCWSYRPQLSGVCQNWRAIYMENEFQTKVDDMVPWLMFYDWHVAGDGRVRSICKLGDPSARRTFLVEDSMERPEDREIFVGAKPWASRYGWVLFTKSLGETALVFLYSPFTNEIVQLPKLIGWMDCNCKVSFSLGPNSSDCVVYVISYTRCFLPLEKRRHSMLCILTCSPGDLVWKMTVHKGDYASLLHVNHGGDNFSYCCFSNGKLVAFDIKNRDWKLLSDQGPKIEKLDGAGSVSAASNEDFVLGWKCRPSDDWNFWRFDMSKRQWNVEPFVLKNSVILTGSTSFTGARKNIYYFLGSVFDWNNGRLMMPWCCCLSDSEWETKVYNWIPKDVHDMKRIWIEPPLRGIWKASDLLHLVVEDIPSEGTPCSEFVEWVLQNF